MMLDSPAKRRKTSPSTSVAIGTSLQANTTLSNPSTPKRASYLSPTKSSLARSHPDILLRSPGRSRLDSRGEILRQEVLGLKSSENSTTKRTSLSAPQTPRQSATAGDVSNPLATALPAPVESFSTAVARAFANPVRRPSLSRSPLRPRQPSAQAAFLLQNLDGKQDVWPAVPMPGPRRVPDVMTFASGAESGLEPELPPTPTQLGISPVPHRPRGLAASSSPRASRSSSGRSRRTKSQLPEQSSPLKPRQRAPVADIAASDGHDSDEETASNDRLEEKLLRATENSETKPNDPFPERILRKKSLLGDLTKQLKRLEDEVSSLESVLSNPDSSNPTISNPDLLNLLMSTDSSCAPTNLDSLRSPSPTLHNPTSLGEKALPYLKLFAPGRLQLSANTTTSSVNSQLLQTHIFSLSAPPPWPAHVFGATFRIVTDLQEHRILSVEMADLRRAHGQGSLRSWINGRLGSPLHRVDVGGLIWGLGRWWDHRVERARAWATLAARYGHQQEWSAIHHERAKESRTLEEEENIVRQEDVRHLLPHLSRTSMEFSATSSSSPSTNPNRRTTRSSASKHRLLLSWELQLDWTCEVQAEIKAVSTLAGRMKKNASENLKSGAAAAAAAVEVNAVFDTLRRRKGLLCAVGDMLGLIAGNSAAGGGVGGLREEGVAGSGGGGGGGGG